MTTSESSETLNLSSASANVTDSDIDSDPPSSVQMSNQLSERLDFSFVEGDKMAARENKPEKRKLNSLSDKEYLEEGELSTDSEFEVPSKLQKRDENVSSESTEIDNSVESVGGGRPDDEEDTTLIDSEQFGEEFHIVDDADIDEAGDDNPDEDSNDELDDNEIYAWLEEGIKKQGTESGDQDHDPGSYTEKEKVVLKEKGKNPFEVLPEGWVAVTHNSGMPVYLHKESRVCTLAKPYFLGPGSVRMHSIPLSGIPCLQYRREKEKEEMEATKPSRSDSSEPVQVNGEQEQSQSKSPQRDTAEQVQVIGEQEQNQSIKREPDNPQSTSGNQGESSKANDLEEVIPAPEIKLLETTEKETSVEPEELLKYCEALFEFKTITVKKFKSWKEKRKHLNELKANARPSLPSDIKLITCPVTPVKTSRAKKKEFVLNPVGKTPLCILHEYVQHVLRVQPVYIFRELESAVTPYSATVKINNVEYGTGKAASKRMAKLEAAKATLDVLIPHLKLHNQDEKKTSMFGDLSFFDEIGVKDPRVSDLCNKAALLKPYQVLQECLKRNYGMGENKIQIDKKVLSNQRSEFSIIVGKHKASVVCKNKREGKQMAAQAMLQLLHPHISSWGSMLRLYSEKTMPGFKEKEEVPVTALQNSSSKASNEILNQLKETMRKLRQRREQIASKGMLKIAYRVPRGQVTSIDL